MESSVTLKSQLLPNQVREVGINQNHWYPVAWAHQLKPEAIIPITIWQQTLALYRDAQNQVWALENVCPHKGVELHLGEVQGERLVCPYHGWEFDGSGRCVAIPYFPKEQKLPPACARSYPVSERYGMIWVFPGDSDQAKTVSMPEIPEYADRNCLSIPISGAFNAHFSICNENTLDVFHGFLHRQLQGWFDPVLLTLEDGEDFVKASYRVSYQGGGLARFLGLGSNEAEVSTRVVSIHYQYPHYHSTLEGVSSLYLMRLPVSADETKSFSLLFLPKIRLPQWLLHLVRPVLIPFVRRFLFMRFLQQDVGMVESEHRTYRNNPERQAVEVNPAIIALQRVIVRQYERFLHPPSSQPETSEPQGDRDDAAAIAASR